LIRGIRFLNVVTVRLDIKKGVFILRFILKLPVFINHVAPGVLRGIPQHRTGFVNRHACFVPLKVPLKRNPGEICFDEFLTGFSHNGVGRGNITRKNPNWAFQGREDKNSRQHAKKQGFFRFRFFIGINETCLVKIPFVKIETER